MTTTSRPELSTIFAKFAELCPIGDHSARAKLALDNGFINDLLHYLSNRPACTGEAGDLRLFVRDPSVRDESPVFYPFATAEAFNEAVSDLLGNSRIDPLSLGLALTMGTLAMQRATAYEYDFLNGAPVLVKRCDHPVTGAPLGLDNDDDGSLWEDGNEGDWEEDDEASDDVTEDEAHSDVTENIACAMYYDGMPSVGEAIIEWAKPNHLLLISLNVPWRKALIISRVPENGEDVPSGNYVVRTPEGELRVMTHEALAAYAETCEVNVLNPQDVPGYEPKISGGKLDHSTMSF